MSTTTNLTASPSITVETVLFGSLIATEITVTLTTIPTSTSQTLSISRSSASSTTAVISKVMSMSSAAPSPSSTLTSSSGLSSRASIGIGIGLALAVLLIIGALLWFFSIHKRYQADVDEMEIGPNATDYRRKAGSIDALSSRPPTNHGALASSQPTRTGSKSSTHSQDIPPIPVGSIERPKAPTPRTSMTLDHDPQLRRDGFF